MSQELLAKYSGEVLVYYMDFTGKLLKNSDGTIADTLTGTPTITEVTTSALTLSSKAVNTAAVVRDQENAALIPYDKEIPISAAAQVTVTGGTAGTQYLLKFLVTTTDGETFEEYGRIQINSVPVP